MPADANSLCEYYITSNLKKSNSFKSTNTSTTLTTNSLSTNETTHSATLNSAQSESMSIDFVKYEKNPMDYLKSKYQLLNSSGQKSHQEVITNGHQLNGNSHLPTQNGTSKIQTPTSSISNGINSKQKSPLPAHSLLELNWSKIRKIGIGLLNLGNNCYLNATLQCLAYTPPLSQWLLSKPHSPTCKFKQIKGFCSLCEVERIISDIFNSVNGCAKPNTLCFNIKKISNVFSVGTQEDASEFFTTLLESMAKSIKFALNSPSTSSLNPLLIGASSNHNNNQQSSSSSTKRVATILDDIFSFQFRSRITCSNCGRLSDTIENTNTWPIDVKFVNDVRKGMQHFLREEVLDGENAYKCDKCNKKTRATKKYSIRTAPNILVVHLKRFDYSYVGKLSHLVSYPETLNLKALSSPETSLLSNVNGSSQASKEPQLHNTNYKLYGVLVHLGYTSHSGHYYSYVRAPNDVWYKADDERVSVVSKNDALNQNAYILFYSRIINEGLSGNEPMPTSTTAANGAHSPTQTNSPLLSNGHSTTNGNHHFNPNTTKLNIPHVIKTESLSAPKKTCSNYLNSLNTTTTLSNSQKIIFKIKSSISQSVSSQKAMPYSLVNNRPNSTLGCSISPNGKVVPLVTNGATNGMAIGALSNGTTLMKAQNGYHSLSSSSTSSLSSSNSTSSLIKSSTSQNESKTRDESPLLKLLVNGNGYHSNETSKQEKSKKSSTTDSSEKKKKKKKKFKRLKQKILKGKYSKSIKKKIKALKNKRDRRKLKKLAKKLGLVDKKKDSKHNHKNQHEQSSNSNSP